MTLKEQSGMHSSFTACRVFSSV